MHTLPCMRQYLNSYIYVWWKLPYVAIFIMCVYSVVCYIWRNMTICNPLFFFCWCAMCCSAAFRISASSLCQMVWITFVISVLNMLMMPAANRCQLDGCKIRVSYASGTLGFFHPWKICVFCLLRTPGCRVSGTYETPVCKIDRLVLD